MKAAILFILLAHGGYWFGGDNVVTVKWAIPEAGTPAAVLAWNLSYGMLVMASGEVPVAAGEAETTVKLQLPEVRVATELTWNYELKDKATGKVLERGTRPIHMLPGKLLQNVAPRVKGRKIFVVENEKGEISELLKTAGIDAQRVASPGDLQLADPDMVLVGEDALPENPAAQEALITRAQHGAGILMFAQHQPAKLATWDVRSRKARPLSWRAEHPLFEGFTSDALSGWATEKDQDLRILSLPPDAAVLELGYVSRETPGKNAVPIDALVATETLGSGRIVFWQIDVPSWKTDPRAQLLLANALDYLLLRPEPTLPQSQRQPDAVKPSVPAGRQLLGAEK